MTTAHEPLKLIVDESNPGEFYWVLVQTSADGATRKQVKAAEDAASSYEGALAAGTRALDALLHPRGAPSSAN